MTKSLCIIPARSGSKRIKNKNIIKFNKQPIIYWSLIVALKSKCFDKIIVSTDSDKIIRIVNKFGLNIECFKRPKSISRDTTPLFEVVRNYLKKSNKKWKKVCCILPSSPLIDFKDIAITKKKLNKKTKFIFPITNYSHPINRSLIKDKNNYIKFKYKNSSLKNTQSFKENFHDAGQFYWGFSSEFLKYKNIFDSKKVKGYYIPNFKVRDIDTINDLRIAQNIFKSIFN